MNKIMILIEEKIENPFAIKFAPKKEFYERVQMTAYRFNKIVEDEVSPTYDELQNLAKYLGVEILDLMEKE